MQIQPNRGNHNDADIFNVRTCNTSSRSPRMRGSLVLRPRFSAKSGDREGQHSIRFLGGRPPVSSWGLCFRQRGSQVQRRSTAQEQTQVLGSQSSSMPFRKKRKIPERSSCFETESIFYLNSGVSRAGTWLPPNSNIAAKPANNNGKCH
jgi:hypothetical protein